jgi:hypothetical protein
MRQGRSNRPSGLSYWLCLYDRRLFSKICEMPVHKSANWGSMARDSSYTLISYTKTSVNYGLLILSRSHDFADQRRSKVDNVAIVAISPPDRCRRVPAHDKILRPIIWKLVWERNYSRWHSGLGHSDFIGAGNVIQCVSQPPVRLHQDINYSFLQPLDYVMPVVLLPMAATGCQRSTRIGEVIWLQKVSINTVG